MNNSAAGRPALFGANPLTLQQARPAFGANPLTLEPINVGSDTATATSPLISSWGFRFPPDYIICFLGLQQRGAGVLGVLDSARIPLIRLAWFPDPEHCPLICRETWFGEGKKRKTWSAVRIRELSSLVYWLVATVSQNRFHKCPGHCSSCTITVQYSTSTVTAPAK